MSDLSHENQTWILHRLRVMGPGELLGHMRRRIFALKDSRADPDKFNYRLACTGAHPVPMELQANASAILRGEWTLFHDLVLKVDDPPKWQKDYLAGCDFWTDESSFRLNHRQLPDGGDIKLIWDLNRWTHLVKLAAAGHAEKVFQWLENWLETNPAFRGWNWMSALETGMRLLNFCWLDAYLRPQHAARMDALAARILPAHAHFTWRYRSFGSSANNHLIGELAGLIVAVSRWPELAKFCAPLADLQRRWESEVLSQFAGDGGNREQAMHYHAFALALCRQVRGTLAHVSSGVLNRLDQAEDFLCNVCVKNEPWDYGDSDDADLIGLPSKAEAPHGWRFFEESGYTVYRSAEWILRWDVSPLGYLATAAHGHLDALHVSLWHCGRALVIDPGTGAYYADAELRNELAGWSAHNGPHPTGLATPRRQGPFLWTAHHEKPQFDSENRSASLGAVHRSIRTEATGWVVEDESPSEFEVVWQFAPSARLVSVGPRAFRLEQAGQSFSLVVSDTWSSVEPAQKRCSPSFRRVNTSPALRLVGRGPCSTIISVA